MVCKPLANSSRTKCANGTANLCCTGQPLFVSSSVMEISFYNQNQISWIIWSLVYTSTPNGLQTAREQFPNQMCEWDCKPALCRLRMVCITFAENRNLSVFCTNTKRTGCAGCPFRAPGVLCSPQVRGKLINRRKLETTSSVWKKSENSVRGYQHTILF